MFRGAIELNMNSISPLFLEDGAEGTLIHGQSLGNLSAPPGEYTVTHK